MTEPVKDFSGVVSAHFPAGFPVGADTLHVGIDDLPFVPMGDGLELQLLHVDLNSGLWINRTRLAAGATVTTHFHAGMVLAVTLEGSWHYLESPDQVNVPGSYLFEPGGSVHTLHAPSTNDGPTTAWFAIWGPNINIDAEGNVLSVIDAHTVLTAYRAMCATLGADCSKIVVMGGA